MKKNYYLAGSLICANFLDLKNDISLLEKGGIDFLHFDVMDGLFVPRYGLFPEILQQVRTISSLPMDFHMMVENAEEYIDTFISYGATQNDIFTVHAESTKHLDRVIRKIKSSGMKAGVAFNPATSLNTVKYLLEEIDLIMLMAINPGIVGHKLIPKMLNKIVDAKNMIEEKNILIAVDGGVNPESAPVMLKNGANMLVCGSQTIFRSHEAPIDKKIADLKRILDLTH